MRGSPDPLLGAPRPGADGATAVLDRRGAEPAAGGVGDAPGVRRRHRGVWLATVALVCLGLVFVTVLPVRSFLAQRDAVAEAEAGLAALQGANQALADRVVALGTDAELERIAREQLNLVRPGEEAFAMLPPQFPSNLPPLFPYPLARRLLEPSG